MTGLGYGSKFAFWDVSVFKNIGQLFTQPWIPPVMPLSIAMLFKIFGVSDLTVIVTSFCYFLLTLLFVFLLAKKLVNNNLTAILSTIAVGFNHDLINYATTGASESPFIFEIVAATYFVSLKNKWGNVAVLLFLIAMYLTRPQAFIYIAGIILYYFLLNFNVKKALIYFIGLSALGLLVDKFILTPLAGYFFIYSILGRGGNVLSQASSASDQLRNGDLAFNFSILDLVKKVFYNLYNFYKLLPQIINPYLFVLFVVGLFQKNHREFKISSLFMAVTTFLVVAASIPFFRYIHPIIPLVYIIAIGTLVEIISKFQETKCQKFSVLVSCFLVFLFVVGQTLGIIFLDSRFERQTHNVGKPPIYVVLSQVLRDNTNLNQVIITNLDTWGSWYGNRKTIWFPLEPKQLIDPTTGKIPFDAIYLTSYLIDDQNYYMNNDWREILNNPNNSNKWTCDGCSEIAKEFTLKGVYIINSSSDYERQDLRAILLVRK